MIRVVKYPYTKLPGEVAFYVGRGKSATQETCTLGNPFRGPTREQAIELYGYYLFFMLLLDEKIQRVMLHIANTAAKHDVVLICHCAPKPCHADIIKQIIEHALDR